MSQPQPPALGRELRNLLQRYLYTGNESPKYFPGCWASQKYYAIDRLQSIDVALAGGVKNVEVVNIILQAYKGGFYTRFETIAFALTKCILCGSDPVKEEAYKAAAEICNTTEELLTFNKFTRTFRSGNGRGWCKHIHDWYSKKTPMELAMEITRVRSRHGRSHRTILRKSHVKTGADHARDAVVKYAIYGLKRAKQLMGDKEGTKEIFDYIQKVEDMRHCEDPVAAAAMASEHQFTLDHVPGHLLTSQDVWNAILPQFTLEQLLYNIQRIHNMGFLTSESTTTAILVSLLNNKDIIQKSKVTTLAVYIALRDYEKGSKPLKYDKAKAVLEREQRRRTRQIVDSNGIWQWNVTKRHPKEAKHWGIDQPPNPAVVEALLKLVDLTWVLTPPTNARYMITLDMRHHMFKGRHFCKTYAVPKKSKKIQKTAATATPATGTPATGTPATGGGDADTEKKSKKHLLAECFHNRNVTPGHAAIILALQILKCEKNVKIAVFTEDGVQLVSIEPNFSSIKEAEFVLRNANLGRVQLDAPIVWAAKNNHKFDVFINMIDRATRFTELDASARGGRGPAARFAPPPSPTKELVDHCPVRALERYRSSAGVGDAKLIVMSLASHRIRTTDGSHEGVLDIVGVDEHVPKVLDAFVLGHFK